MLMYYDFGKQLIELSMFIFILSFTFSHIIDHFYQTSFVFN